MTESHLKLKALFDDILRESDNFENNGVKAQAVKSKKGFNGNKTL